MFSNRLLLPFILLLLFIGCAPSDHPEADALERLLEQGGTSFDLWIRDGAILNGIDSLPKRGDILIQGDELVYIGPVDSSLITATQVIDAAGKLVTPGFIDAHAHGDPMSTPGFENFLAMGVTTICLGQDGSSPALPRLSDWMQQVDSTGPGVNIAMFAGHGTLRQLSGTGYQTVPSSKELEQMKILLQEAFDAGCFGMSTGLEYTPGTYAGDGELLELARIVGTNDGLIMSHIRNEDDDAVEVAIRELLRQGQYCAVQVSHMKVVYGKGGERAEAILSLLDSARQSGAHQVTADLYPYTASYTGIGIVFPAWAKAPNDYLEVKKTRREELLAHLRARITARNGPKATLFGTAPYAGKTLADVAKEQGRPYEEVLLDIGPGGASGAYFVMDEALQARLFADPYVMVCSDGSPTMHHPRGYGSFAKIIETFVYQQQLISLAEAIRKMSALTAKTIGLTDRGSLEVGKKADLLIFDPQQVKANADFTQPHRLADGFDVVILNGKIGWRKGTPDTARHGKMLRKQ